MKTERIIITFNPDGTFRGASATDFGGLPIGLDSAAVAEAAPAINSAALARVGEMETEIGSVTAALAEKQAYQDAMVQKVSSVLQSGDPEQFKALAVDFLTPEQEKARAEKLAQLEALKAELGIA